MTLEECWSWQPFQLFQPFQPFQADYPLVSYADLYQMAAAVSIEHAGGPKIDMKYGRKALVAGVW